MKDDTVELKDSDGNRWFYSRSTSSMIGPMPIGGCAPLVTVHASPSEADQRWRDTRTVVPCDGDDVIGYWLPASNFGKRHVGHVHYFNKRWNAVGEETHWCGTPDFWMPTPPLPSPPDKEESK